MTANTFQRIVQSDASFRVTKFEQTVVEQLRELIMTKRHSMITLRYDSVACRWYIYASNLAATCEANPPKTGGNGSGLQNQK